MKLIAAIIASTVLVSGCAEDGATQAEAPTVAEANTKSWQTVFFDDFDTFNSDNWRDQILWVNGEDQCYLRDGQHGTREVSDGTLKLRVVDLGEKQPCDNMDKHGKQHADTQYVAGRISSKNRQEFAKGRWTARLKVPNSGQDGMFPAWWLLGSLNNEPPIEEPNETVCWPMIGSGEIDIFEHHGDGGPNHYAARTIKNGGACDQGDWQALMLVKEANFDEYQDYGVAFEGDDIVFYLNSEEVYRNDDIGPELPEPMFAILNFAKINANAMTVKHWEMEVDWVKWEEWK
jgi:beta-glucanase (GH16 family)